MRSIWNSSLTWNVTRRATAGALAVCMVIGAFSSTTRSFEIVVPAYFYPGTGSPWTAMTNAADEVDITAIMNPGNGPGNASDSNYVSAVNAFRAAGGRVIGYVYSGYGARAAAQVKADIDKYAAWYAIDGIFVDEMSTTGPAEKLNYYKSIYDHAKSIDPDWEVMGNPGTTTMEAYATWPTADRLMVFENVGSAYGGHTPSAWNANYDREKFVHLVHTEASGANMAEFIALAAERNVGGIYVTNDVMANPWDTLPSYWQAEVDAVAALHDTFAASDFNEDGDVDGADLARWEGGFGDASVRLWHHDGDATGDGVVDGADFLLWQQQLGASAVGSGQAVPEPASLAIAAIAALVVRLSRFARGGAANIACN
jgi:hypothetical protein